MKAWKRARYMQANMDTLIIALSTTVAFLYSLLYTIYPEFLASKGIQPAVYYESEALILAFILVGKFLEERA